MFDDLRDLYQEVILDHGRKPRNFRRLDDPDRTARGDNPMCGDRIELFLKLGADGGIADADRTDHRIHQHHMAGGQGGGH